MDENVGKILSHLEQTGKLENTIIFFINDHHPDDYQQRELYKQDEDPAEKHNLVKSNPEK